MAHYYTFYDIARLPSPDDNVAIATQTLHPNTHITLDHAQGAHSQTASMRLNTTVLEGHRFAIAPIAKGLPLLSWGLPFGTALRDIAPGEYVTNASMLQTLSARDIDVHLPVSANFQDNITPYHLDPHTFQATPSLPLYDDTLYFQGFPRARSRGTGTRNYILLIGTTSLSSSYVRQLEKRLKAEVAAYSYIDGAVAIAHTEGGSAEVPNNYELILRTLAGFMVHPNAAAVLCVDYGHEVVQGNTLAQYMRKYQYPLDAVPHTFLTLEHSTEQDLARGEEVVRGWLEHANRQPRHLTPISELKLALQCGGSDAFSGVSGNPLAAQVAQELIRYGGAANLAETDELIGAESYILQKVRDIDVAKKFLAAIERFKTRAAWHGTSAEGNPSGGNKLRGLYNIVLKSLGAAMKKAPDVRLDEVLDYSERMTKGGYYFMDSPGNDLESIAGQVASGCNLIFFVTGNGSITNFPFVPTLKIVTTSARYDHLKEEMDINAGAYLDGTPMADLTTQTLTLAIQTASGDKSIGEKAGHAQVQLWRNWQQRDATQLPMLLTQPTPSGAPLMLEPPDHVPTLTPLPIPVQRQQLGLVLPTSLCSSQITALIASQLNTLRLGRPHSPAMTFTSLPHTEGCGVSGGRTAAMQSQTLLNYLQHPYISEALLLEHGCEITHNDHMRHTLIQLGLTPEAFGWLSIQRDGGIAVVMERAQTYFETQLERPAPPLKASPCRIGIMASGALTIEETQHLLQLVHALIAQGHTLIMPEALLAPYAQQHLTRPIYPTLDYGQYAQKPGLHLMYCPTSHWIETLTGLGATGPEIVLALCMTRPEQRHPFIPVVQLTTRSETAAHYSKEFPYISPTALGTDAVIPHLTKALTKTHVAHGEVDFQITRGALGLSM